MTDDDPTTAYAPNVGTMIENIVATVSQVAELRRTLGAGSVKIVETLATGVAPPGSTTPGGTMVAERDRQGQRHRGWLPSGIAWGLVRVRR